MYEAYTIIQLGYKAKADPSKTNLVVGVSGYAFQPLFLTLFFSRFLQPANACHAYQIKAHFIAFDYSWLNKYAIY